MIIIEENGNLLDSNCDVICHQVNCKQVMRSGIAKEIKERYPQVYEDYIDYSQRYKLTILGDCLLVKTSDYYVANLFAQNNYGYDGKRYTNYEAFFSSLTELKKDVIKINNIKIIGFPTNIGCKRGGGDWRIIKPMIEVVFGDLDIIIKFINYGE